MNQVMRVLWPAFLMACAMELVVFALVDPQDLHWLGHPLALPRQAVYTGAFFVFWLAGAGACALTALLGQPPAAVNACPAAHGERPDGCPQR